MMTEPREYIVSYAPGTEPQCDISGSITEIVRCRDCRYYEYGYDPIAEECIVSDCRYTGFEVTGDDYCAWGVRADG